MKKERSAYIIYMRLGQKCIRRRPTHVSNPRTKKQQEARRRFAERYARKKDKG